MSPDENRYGGSKNGNRWWRRRPFICMIEAYKKAYNSCEIDEQATCKSMIFSLKTI